MTSMTWRTDGASTGSLSNTTTTHRADHPWHRCVAVVVVVPTPFNYYFYSCCTRCTQYINIVIRCSYFLHSTHGVYHTTNRNRNKSSLDLYPIIILYSASTRFGGYFILFGSKFLFAGSIIILLHAAGCKLSR
jgi:hypothetical protein